MATCREVIRSALRKIGVIASGEEPSITEAQDALDSLQSMYLEAVNGGRFGKLIPVIATADYEAGENEIITSGGFTITLPDTIEDEWTGDDRPPKDLSIVMVTTEGEEPEISVYDAYRGEWVALNGLALGDDAPLSGRGSDGLSATLAIRLADEYAATVSASVISQSASFISALSNKRTSRETEVEFY